MLFQDVVISSLKTQNTIEVEDEMIDEGIFFPISPLLAYASFKRKVFDKLKNSKAFKIASKPKEMINKAREVKGGALIAKEKLKANAGLKSGSGDNASLYRLTPEQLEVMADIMNKYGKELAKEINHFRVNVLAPYQLIKRLIHKNKSLTSTDVTGMNKEEFSSALESGRRKIKRRGSFFDKSQELQNKLRDFDTTIRELQSEKQKLINGKDLDNGILEKVYSSYQVGEKDFSGHSLDTLKSAYEELTRNYKALSGYREDQSKMSPAEVLTMIQRNHQLREKGPDSQTKEKKEEGEVTEKKGNFAMAFGRYMIRRGIRESFKNNVSDNIYRKTYEKVIDDLIAGTKEKKADMLKQFVDLRKTIDFSGKEGSVWGKLPHAPSEYSGDESHYYQKYKEEDFQAPKYYERPQELQDAEREIENEIKRFERKLAAIVSPEDLARLKKYRVINNIITVSELKDPDTLFKTQAELQMIKSVKASKQEQISEADYIHKLREWASKELEDSEELESNKKSARELAQKMRDQGDGDIVEANHDLLSQILSRKTLEARKISKEVKEEPEEVESKEESDE